LTIIDIRNPRLKAGGRVITVTSTHTSEGKTTNVVWLAAIAAQAGKKVLVIDADMRRPSVHKKFGIGNSRGLVDYLSNRLPLDETIYKKDGSNVHVMTSKAIPTHALTLLTSERMDSLIRRVREDYDLVILDGPTSHLFSDSLVCAKLSDKTLFVVEWKKTKRDQIVETLKQFKEINYKDIALILNKVDEKKILKIRKQDMAYLADHKAA
jgi:capsular exopolysaccharide synthesis family protein